MGLGIFRDLDIYRGKPKLQYTSSLHASVRISLWQSKEREKGIMGLGIFGDSKVERARSFFRVLFGF